MLPFASGGCVVHPHVSVAQRAGDFTQAAGQQAAAARARQGRWRHLGFHAQYLGHGITSFWSKAPVVLG